MHLKNNLLGIYGVISDFFHRYDVFDCEDEGWVNEILSFSDAGAWISDMHFKLQLHS